MSYDPFAAWNAAYWDWIRQFYGLELGRRLESETARPSPAREEAATRKDRKDDDFRPAAPKPPPSPPAPKFREDEDEEEADLQVKAESPRHTFDNLIVPPATREALDLALNKVVHAKIIYEDFNMKSVDTRGGRTVLNFFGPPGTGKTFAAHCVAHRLGKQILEADYSQLESMWFGETEKNIAAIFDEARQAGAVLFFDEADTILSSRVEVNSSASHHVNRCRSVMLIQLERFDGIVVFATNNIGNYDKAFARRIVAHVEFTLPDAENRRRLWRYLLPAQVPRREEVSDEWLGALSEGFAGGDILNAAWLMATSAAVKPEAERFVTNEDAARAIASVRIGLDFVGRREQGADRRGNQP